MNLKVQRIIFAILTIASFVAIFIFSSQNGEESGSLSREVSKKIIDILQIDKNLSEVEKENLIENSQIIIRKLAHFTIYTIVGINIFGFINTFSVKNKLMIAFVIGCLYAVSDEIHQMFTDDRAASIRDVFIDSCGVLFGICIFLILVKIVNYIKIKKYNSVES